MKKFSIQTVLIIVLGFAAQQFFPWWSIVIVAALIGAMFNFKNSLGSWLAGFVAVGLLWGGFAGFMNYGNLGLLSSNVGELMGGIDGSTLVYVTGLLGGVIGGFGAMTGTLGRKMLAKAEA